MDKYTIYCTAEQTKKACNLDAPLEIGEGKGTVLCKYQNYNTYKRCIIPTAEQMIGWIDELGLLVVTTTEYNNYHWEVWESSHIIDMKETETISSRKEATLAAIDAALEYLTENKAKQ